MPSHRHTIKRVRGERACGKSQRESASALKARKSGTMPVASRRIDSLMKDLELRWLWRTKDRRTGPEIAERVKAALRERYSDG